MDNIQERMQRDIGAKLMGAPDSRAKSELIEELAQNLLARYQDLLATGMDSETAYRTAMDDLGDTAELVEYLNSLGPEESIPNPNEHKQNANAYWSTINSGTSGASFGAFVSSLDGIMNSVGDILTEAFESAKNTMKNARVTIADIGEQAKQPGGYTYRSPKGSVSFTVHNNKGEAQASPPWQAELEARLQEKEDALRKNLEEHGITGAEADELVQASLAAARPGIEEELRKKWAEHTEAPQFTSDTAFVSFTEDGDMAMDGFAIHTIDVEVDGDIEISETKNAAEKDVVIGGDTNKLSVTSQNGVLTIRNNNSTVNNFMRVRGWQNPNVELKLPMHPWTAIRAVTRSGDVDFDVRRPVDQVEVSSISGDVDCRVEQCGTLKMSSVSGDVQFNGNAETANCSSVSGDVNLEGAFGDLKASTASGDIEVTGSTGSASCSSSSGDLSLESNLLPGALNLNTKSGDIEVAIPDEGPFSVNFRSMSGEFYSDFFDGVMGGKHGVFTYGNGQGPQYSMQSFSGDLNLRSL